MGNDPCKKFETYLDKYMIALMYIKDNKNKLNILDLLVLYSLFYKSYFKILIYVLKRKGFDFPIKQHNIKIMLGGIPYIPVIFIEYLVEKVNI
jgi:hypothetical protein